MMAFRKIQKIALVSVIAILTTFLHGFVLARDFEMKQLSPYENEYKTLPEFCFVKKKYGFRKHPLVDKWRKVFKNDYVHMHHYCFALNCARRAQQIGITKQEKKFETGRAIDNFEYMLKRTSPNWVLRAETHIRIGQCKLSLGDFKGAQVEFHKAKLIQQKKKRKSK